MKQGQRVRITIPAGLLRAESDRRFSGSCEPGTIGTYIGRHSNKKLKGWHLIQVGEWIAPLASGQFDVEA